MRVNPRSIYQLKIVLGVLLLSGAYCAGSGRFDLWPGWCYAGFSLATLGASYLVAIRVAPDLIVERVSWDAGVKRWDRPIVMWLMLGPVVICLVAGLEARRCGVRDADFEVVLGYALGLAGSVLTQAAAAVNRFYAPVVRVQKERGHTVVDSGPYRLVRHPGNMGNLILLAATPLMLASDWAWIPVAVSIALTIVRTALEDRTLRVELKGYQAYASRVPNRLVPGLW
jgi:protein-S-isoprenylcysteine O-methyltransferase Ste14